MKLFAFKRSDGCISVATVMEDTHNPLKKIDPNGWYVDSSELPNDSGYWFNCLTADDDKRIYVSLDKAREFTRDRLRRERKPLLEALDVAFQRKLEMNPVPDPEIIAEKNRLRDITLLPATCRTIEELKVLTCQKLS